MPRLPPLSTLFPYTTLFRSLAQFPLAEKAVSALGVVVWPMVEFEADDALGTAAARFKKNKAVEQILKLHHRPDDHPRSEEHTSELQSRLHLVCRLLLEKKKK